MRQTTQTTKLRLILACAATVALSLPFACGGKNKKKTGPTGGSAATPGSGAQILELADAPDGLHFRLSEGAQKAPAAIQRTVIAGQKLSDAEAKKLLSRLTAIKADADDKKAFALRDRSKPPPRTGKTVKKAFPPPQPKGGAPDVKGSGAGPLKVERWAPEGDVPIAPHLSVTFSQPMVAVTSHADTVAKGVPVKLSPQPKGSWRWVGTRTLLFDPDVRFPQATQYTVTVPSGTKSAVGKALAEDHVFTFTTPSPRLKQSYPAGKSVELRPIFFAQFDQKVDPAAVLKTIKVHALGDRYPVRLATDAEIEGDDTVAQLVARAEAGEQSGRYLAFAIDRDLPKDTPVVVEIGPGTPSAEGPRKTTKAQSFSFRTFGPLEVVDARCWARDCPPGAAWNIRFSNAIAVDAYEMDLIEDEIEVSPALAGRSIYLSGSSLTIRGRGQPRTLHTVTIPAEIKDVHGQTLGQPEELEFQVGSPRPSLWGPRGLVVIDPSAKKPTLDIFSTTYPKLSVKLYRVDPRKDWRDFVRWMRDYYGKQSPPGTEVSDQTIEIDGDKDRMTETRIDLAPALGSGRHGHVVAVVEPTPWTRRGRPPQLKVWMQSTDLALDAFVDSGELVAWATDLGGGEAASGVKLEIAPYGASATSGADGTARIPLAKKRSKREPNVLLGSRGKDVALLPENIYSWNRFGSWYQSDRGQSLRWFVFDDRAMYKPGEKVRLKGWIRKLGLGESGDVAGLDGAASKVRWTVVGAQGNDLAKGSTKVSPLGGFDLSFQLPKTANLGHARVKLETEGRAVPSRGRTHSHGFQIQEFRRPEFEVTAKASEGPHLVGESAQVTAQASYYAGGPLPGAATRWDVRATPTRFTPPNRDDFIFGVYVPWWIRHQSGSGQSSYQSLQTKTDASGAHVLDIDLLSVKPPQPMQMSAQVSVTDVNRQQWAATAELLVHPSQLYVGLRSKRWFVERGTPIEVDMIAVDHDGKAVTGRDVTLQAVRLDWKYRNGTYEEVEKDPQSCSLKSAQDAIPCSFATTEGGRYKITAVIRDTEGRPNHTEMTIWVSGGERPPSREVEQEEVTLVPDKEEYRPGETAEILVQAPFFPAEALVSYRRSGIVSYERIRMDGPTTILKVPVTSRHMPNLHVQVDLVGQTARLDDDGKPATTLPPRPAFAAGSIDLKVPPHERSLEVTVEPKQAEIEPGGKTAVDVSVRDAKGQPVSGAELAVVVVDEAILSLTSYQMGDILSAFHPHRDEGTRDYHLRSFVKLARPDADALGRNRGSETASGGDGDDAEAEPMPAAPAGEADMAVGTVGRGAGGARARKSSATRSKNGGSSAANTPIAVRRNFDPLAVFAPKVRTDGRGTAQIPVEMPDNLTRYRIMVVAVAGEKTFGKGESNITARMPLMVRPSPPRFLNFGDRFELPVVLQNQTSKAMKVEVAVRASNAEIGVPGKRVTVPANDRIEVRFPAAAEMPGTARFQVAGTSGRWSDAAELALPVWTPATTEAFATYGVIDKGAIRQPVSMPGKVVKEFGGLEISTSSTQLQALTDAFVYLVDYPFECSEQMASRVLAIAALRDVLSAFQTEGLPPPDEIEAAVARDIERLQAIQNWDGGFGFWRRHSQSWPYLSIHVAHALVRAKNKGFDVPTSMMARSKRYLQQVERKYPHWYPEEVKRTLTAYALYVRHLMGDDDRARARKLLAEGGGLKDRSMEAIGWILATLASDRGSSAERRKIHRHLANKTTETAGTAHFVTSYSDGAHLLLHSSRRVDGIILEALIDDKPKSSLIPKLVRGLLAHRKRGRWSNTQENAFVLLAMDRYFNVFEKTTPSFVARAWLGDGLAGEHQFRGRSTDRVRIDVPMSYLAKNPDADLVLQKQGKGRLYYRIGMTYAPASLRLDPADHGFAVTRLYEAVDDADDVSRLPDGTWKIEAGARVRVRVTMVAESRRYHVALVDPLPAGLEPMNPALAVTGDLPDDPTSNKSPYWWWQRTWYEHQNMRDERVEAFASLLWEGVHEYSYVARATTPGRFVVPPPKAEEMYHPETFGRGGSDVVIVE